MIDQIESRQLGRQRLRSNLCAAILLYLFHIFPKKEEKSKLTKANFDKNLFDYNV